MPVAQTVAQLLLLTGTVIDELRRQRVLLRHGTGIEAIVRHARQQAEQFTREIMSDGTEADKLARLNVSLTQ